MTSLALRWPAVSFVAVTFIIALLPFMLVRAWGVDPFGDARAMPLLLIMVWSPNIAALCIALLDGGARPLLATLTGLPSGVAPWLWALSPLAVLAIVGGQPGALGDGKVGATALMLLVGLNVILGPLGEELGWRGFLLPRLLPRLGTLGAALVVGLVWALWHLPLWFIDSPHAAIPFWVFGATVLCFSVILTTIWTLSGASLWPAIAFHLLVNVVVGWVELRGGMTGPEIYRAMLPWYAAVAGLAAGWSWWTLPKVCSV